MEPSGSEPVPDSVTLFAGRVMVLSAPALAVGDWLAADAPAISSQLMFHPAPVVDCSLMVCVPAARLMVAVVVCQDWKPPVVGTFTVARTVPPLFFIWNCAPVLGVATLKLMA